MGTYSAHYGLEMLDGSSPFSTDGQKYTFADRAQIDRLLYQGAQGHHHNGAAAGTANPTLPGTLVASSTGGTIAAGLTVWYEYTFVDVSGAETLPSPPVSVTLAAGGSAPANPTIAPHAGTGTLPPGDYFYAISAYTTGTTNETLANATAYCFLAALGEITLTFPTLPGGATGFNIYRKGSNQLNFYYLDSSTSSSYTDDGSVDVSATRSLPTVANDNSTNSILFVLPTAIPAGYTWNLYRTTRLGQWTGALMTSVLSGAVSYTDVGAGNIGGASPPLSSQLVGSPSQIDLTSEVTGLLPAAHMGPGPFVVTFPFAGTLTTQTGKMVWVNEFASATVVSARATLGRGAKPVSTSVIVDVDLVTLGATPTYTSIFPSGPLPQVAVGLQGGSAQAPPSTTTLATGNGLSVNITQVGGGATPLDHDLTVSILLLAS